MGRSHDDSEHTSRVIAFTTRGEDLLDQLVASLVAEVDGSPRSIAAVLQQVAETDIGELADRLDALATDQACAPNASTAADPDAAARRRLASPPPPSRSSKTLGPRRRSR